MCGRFGLFASAEQVEARFGLEASSVAWTPRYNIAPSQDLLGVFSGGVARTLRWGLIPADTAPGLRPGRNAPARGREWINARVETVATKRSFRDAFATRRCLVPASGYFEWEGEEEVGPDAPFRLTPPSARRPHWHALEGEVIFAIAGIVARWVPEAGREAIESCALITAPALPGVAPVHSRMPLVLPRGWEEEWLERAPSTPQLASLMADRRAYSWTTRVVSDSVNSTRNEGAMLLEPR